eukprot:sb/3463002/
MLLLSPLILLLVEPASALRFIVLQLPETTSVSAQFRLTGADSEGWDCPSAVHPITYPLGNGETTKAASLEMEVGGVVDCLGLGVRVVEKLTVERWKGEGSPCQQRSNEMTELEINSYRSTISFTFVPNVPFRVYFTEPTPECVTMDTVFVDRPELEFSYPINNISLLPNDCHVNGWVPGMDCNMTVRVSNQVVSTGTRVTSLSIPDLIWGFGNLTNVTCHSMCSLSTSTTLENQLSIDVSGASPAMAKIISRDFMNTTGMVDPCQSYLISLSLLIAAFLVTLLSTLFLFFVSLSAQFRLTGADSEGWDCPSAVHPITYPLGNGETTKAASLEMEVGGVVDCLGLGVRVVEKLTVERWKGEGSPCQQRSNEMTELEINSYRSTISFTFVPNVPFRVYFTEPTPECVTMDTVFVDRPELEFSYPINNISLLPNDCHVNGWVPGMDCNMTVRVSNQVVSTGTRVTSLSIPDLIWGFGNLTNVTCHSMCSLSTSTTLENQLSIDVSGASPAMAKIISRDFMNTTGMVDPCQSYLISLSLLIAAFLVTLLSTLFLFFVSRNLNSRLNNKNKAFGLPQRRKARTTMYSQAGAQLLDSELMAAINGQLLTAFWIFSRFGDVDTCGGRTMCLCHQV